eukprot:GFUD01045715.1.p1 GENE.GFUD01045715.1~~GFUD01045715.1.p1  ORF type:complete len:266 (+),score=78.40 GFUD01045715.1:95-892(+)
MASNSMYIMWGSYYDHLFLHGIVPLVLLGFCYFRISTTMSESSRGSSLRLLSTDNNQMKKDSDDGQPFHTEIFELQNMSNNKQQSVESAQENVLSDECSDPLPVSTQFHSSQANLLSDRTVSITVPTAVGRGEQMTTTEQQDSEEGPAYRKRGPRQASADHATLLMVVLTFLLCHSLRFVAKLYQVIILDEYLDEKRVAICTHAGRHPIPALWFCVANLNHVLMVLNSSLNFYIYCVVGKRFRVELFSFLRSAFVKVGGRPRTAV